MARRNEPAAADKETKMSATRTKESIYAMDRLCGIGDLKHEDPKIQSMISGARAWLARAREAGESETVLHHCETVIRYWENRHMNRPAWGRFVYSEKLNHALIFLRDAA